MVLQKLWEFKLYIKLSKCVFDAVEIHFLNFVVNRTGIVMEPSRVNSVATWLIPRTFIEIQVFFRFANFYQCFIDGFSHVASGLLDMVKGGVKSKFNNKNFAMTAEAFEAFNELKKYFTIASMLVHYEPKRRITFRTNASAFVISGIISQLIKTSSQ